MYEFIYFNLDRNINSQGKTSRAPNKRACLILKARGELDIKHNLLSVID